MKIAGLFKTLTGKAASKAKDVKEKATSYKDSIKTSNSQAAQEPAAYKDIKQEPVTQPVVQEPVLQEEPVLEEEAEQEPVAESKEEPEDIAEEASEEASEEATEDTAEEATEEVTGDKPEDKTEPEVKPEEKTGAAVGEQMTIAEAAEEAAADTATSEEPPAETPVKEEPAAAAAVSPAPVITETSPSQEYDYDDKVPVDILAGAKRGIKSAFNKAKSFAWTGKIGDRTDDSADYGYISDTDDRAGRKTQGWISTQKDNDLRDFDTSNVEEVIKKQFDSLDMITTSAIAIMLSDTKTKAASPYIRDLKKPDIRVILLKFCQDTYYATDMEQLNELFNKSYYRWKIRRYLGKVTVFVKRGIGDSLPRRTALSKARVTKNRFVNRICETISTFESVKYISALSGNEEISDSKRNYKLDHLSENYKDALIYLVDLLLTCTCISKMLFVERMIRNMDVNSEFNKIITNMAKEIDNHNLIISKSRPIYKQYYQSELGYINGDDLLYGMAITIMVNRAKKVDIKNTEILQVNTGSSNTREFKQEMLKWLDGLSKDDAVDDIGTLILQKINLSIRDNYGLLTNALQELTNWENYYKQRVAFYKKERDKERYLKGDFKLEKEEIVKIR